MENNYHHIRSANLLEYASTSETRVSYLCLWYEEPDEDEHAKGEA